MGIKERIRNRILRAAYNTANRAVGPMLERWEAADREATGQCKYDYPNGAWCVAGAAVGSDYCLKHDPDHDLADELIDPDLFWHPTNDLDRP